MRSFSRFVSAAAVICGVVICEANMALAANMITVESKSVGVGANGVTVAIKITNDVPIRNIVLPLIFRTGTTGAYITTALTAQRTPGGRLDGVLTVINVISTFGTPSDSCGHHPGGFRNPSPPADGVSPDGVLFSLGKLMPWEDPLSAGKDSTTGSLFLTFDVNSTPESSASTRPA